MAFLTIQSYVPVTAPIPAADTGTVVALSGATVPNYRLPVRAGFSSADRPRRVAKAVIPNDNAGYAEGDVIRRGMLHDSLA